MCKHSAIANTSSDSGSSLHLPCLSLSLFRLRMPVVIESAFEISMDGYQSSRVQHDRHKQIEGEWFIKVRPYDMSFIALVTHDMFKLPSAKDGKLTLAAASGFKALTKLRNDAVLEFETASDNQDADTEALFEVKPENKKRKSRINAARLQ